MWYQIENFTMDLLAIGINEISQLVVLLITFNFKISSFKNFQCNTVIITNILNVLTLQILGSKLLYNKLMFEKKFPNALDTYVY